MFALRWLGHRPLVPCRLRVRGGGLRPSKRGALVTGSFGSPFALRAQFEVDRGQVAGGAAHGQARHDARPVLVAHEDHAPHWRSRRRSPCSGMSLSTTAPYFVFTPSKEPSESRFELQVKTRSRGAPSRARAGRDRVRAGTSRRAQRGRGWRHVQQRPAGRTDRRCKKRTCEICGLTWAKDWRVVLFANLKRLGSLVMFSAAAGTG